MLKKWNWFLCVSNPNRTIERKSNFVDMPIVWRNCCRVLGKCCRETYSKRSKADHSIQLCALKVDWIRIWIRIWIRVWIRVWFQIKWSNDFSQIRSFSSRCSNAFECIAAAQIDRIRRSTQKWLILAAIFLFHWIFGGVTFAKRTVADQLSKRLSVRRLRQKKNFYPNLIIQFEKVLRMSRGIFFFQLLLPESRNRDTNAAWLPLVGRKHEKVGQIISILRSVDSDLVFWLIWFLSDLSIWLLHLTSPFDFSIWLLHSFDPSILFSLRLESNWSPIAVRSALRSNCLIWLLSFADRFLLFGIETTNESFETIRILIQNLKMQTNGQIQINFDDSSPISGFLFFIARNQNPN